MLKWAVKGRLPHKLLATGGLAKFWRIGMWGGGENIFFFHRYK